METSLNMTGKPVNYGLPDPHLIAVSAYAAALFRDGVAPIDALRAAALALPRPVAPVGNRYVWRDGRLSPLIRAAGGGDQ